MHLSDHVARLVKICALGYIHPGVYRDSQLLLEE